jgi:hypothetical protein
VRGDTPFGEHFEHRIADIDRFGGQAARGALMSATASRSTIFA